MKEKTGESIMRNRLSTQKLFCSVLGAILAAMLFAGAATATPVETDFSRIFSDAVTGDNEFTDSSGTHYWYVNTEADSYEEDVYERPTAQNYEYVKADGVVGNDSEMQAGSTYSAAGFSDPTYFGYLDIVNGLYGYDDTYMYFGIELYSIDKVGNDGSHTSDFGESSFYNIRFSSNQNGAGGLMLSSQAAADLDDPGKEWYQKWETQKSFGYHDANSDVGGPDGITATDENPGSMDGFEDIIIADGQGDNGSKHDILWVRYDPAEGDSGPVVSFALDYRLFNELFDLEALDPLNPEEMAYHIVYEANRGTKDNENYLWNDKWSPTEAGSPYTPLNEPQNVYELDTLRGFSGAPAPVPEPATLILFGAGLIGLAGAGRKQLRGLSLAQRIGR